jgi:hypothetical protein
LKMVISNAQANLTWHCLYSMFLTRPLLKSVGLHTSLWEIAFPSHSL